MIGWLAKALTSTLGFDAESALCVCVLCCVCMCARVHDASHQVLLLWEQLTARVGRALSIGDPLPADLAAHADLAALKLLQTAGEVTRTCNPCESSASPVRECVQVLRM